MKTIKQVLLIVAASVTIGFASAQQASPQQELPAEASVNLESSENQAFSDVQNEGVQAVPQQAPAELPQPVPQQTQPQKSGNHAAALSIIALLFVVTIAAIAMAFMARKEAARTRRETQDELNAIKAAVKQRFNQNEDAAAQLEQRLLRHISDAQRATMPQPQPQAAAQQTAEAEPKRFYLAPPDEKGRFANASPVFEHGNSIFELTSTDGRCGTFTVIDDNSVFRLALMMPTENLTRACTGNGIQVSHGAQRIVTDKPGTAVLQSGRWQVLQPAEIHYE